MAVAFDPLIFFDVVNDSITLATQLLDVLPPPFTQIFGNEKKTTSLQQNKLYTRIQHERTIIIL
jgi:hypothetical protein